MCSETCPTGFQEGSISRKVGRNSFPPYSWIIPSILDSVAGCPTIQQPVKIGQRLLVVDNLPLIPQLLLTPPSYMPYPTAPLRGLRMDSFTHVGEGVPYHFMGYS